MLGQQHPSSLPFPTVLCPWRLQHLFLNTQQWIFHVSFLCSHHFEWLFSVLFRHPGPRLLLFFVEKNSSFHIELLNLLIPSITHYPKPTSCRHFPLCPAQVSQSNVREHLDTHHPSSRSPPVVLQYDTAARHQQLFLCTWSQILWKKIIWLLMRLTLGSQVYNSNSSGRCYKCFSGWFLIFVPYIIFSMISSSILYNTHSIDLWMLSKPSHWGSKDYCISQGSPGKAIQQGFMDFLTHLTIK